MQALVLDDDAGRRTAVAADLMARGFDVAAVSDADAARRFAQGARLDILVLAERAGGRLTHAVALLAEWRNPRLAAVLLSDRRDPDADELFALIPSLRAILGRDVAPATVGRLAADAARSMAARPPEPPAREGQDGAPTLPAVLQPGAGRPAPASVAAPPPGRLPVPSSARAAATAGPDRLAAGAVAFASRRAAPARRLHLA